MNSLVRRPDTCLGVPPADEIRSNLWRARAPVATYVRRPDDDHPQNAWLYVCENRDYKLESLEARARRDARRALRELRIEFIDVPTFLDHGVRAFCETRTRVGLSDGTPQVFCKTFGDFGKNPAHKAIGAWAGDVLAAFLTLVVVDDWVDIYPYASDEHLRLCPNDGMIHYVLDYFLAQRGFRLVNYGLSSIQEVSKAQGLHAFKKKVGFECRPVHRAFVFHPLLKPLANRGTLWGLRIGRWLRPRSRTLRKAAGLLATYLGDTPMPDDPEEQGDERSSGHGQ
jgi:hypothetical protein